MRADERLVALHLDDDVEVVRAEMFARRRRAPGDEKAVGLRASLGSVGALARGSNDAPAEGFDGVDDAVVVCGDAAVVDALGALGGFVREAHERLAANLREGLAREALAVESRGDHGEDATLSGREGWRRARGGWVRWVASRGRGARERVKRREMGGGGHPRRGTRTKGTCPISTRRRTFGRASMCLLSFPAKDPSSGLANTQPIADDDDERTRRSARCRVARRTRRGLVFSSSPTSDDDNFRFRAVRARPRNIDLR